MSRGVFWRLVVLAVVVGFATLGFWLVRPREGDPPAAGSPARVELTGGPGPAQVRPDSAPVATPALAGTVPDAAQLAADTAARVEKIKRDYDEVRSKAAADYAAGGKDFPGQLNGFLRQLALLEREKRVDLAALLTPRELEDLEMRESTAGQMVQRLLGDTAATDEQRRAVFRLQRDFEDRFALRFDLSPAALLERESARLQLNDRIRALLGDALFAQWLRGEGGDYPQLAALAARQGLPLAAGLELWRVRTEYARRGLELQVATGMSAAQRRAAQSALAQQTELRLMLILGAGTVQLARDGALQWLPKP